MPHDVSGVRSFLGLTNYFRGFVQGYANLVGPMTNLLRKTVAFRWSADCQKAFEGIKHALTKAPVLVMPDYDKPFELVADACGFGVGAALLQGGRPIAFLCRKFTDAERNYGVGEQELLAVVHAMRTWRCYLEGVNADMFTVVTDHNPLTYLQTQNTLSRRQVRWSEYLQMFTYKWLYRPGKSNIADPLSRNPAVVACMLPIVDGQALGNSLMCQGDHQQMTVKWAQSVGGPKVSESMPDELMASCAAVTRSKVSKPTPTEVPAAEHVESDVHSQESASDNVSDSCQPPGSLLFDFQRRCAAAYHKDPACADGSYHKLYTERHGLWWHGDKLVIPDADALRQYVLREMHDAPSGGHFAIRKTRKSIERFYTWPALNTDVEDYVSTCPGCQRNKPSNQKPAGLLQPLPIPTRKWGSVSMDLITSLPETAAGNSAIVVFVCRLTKMVHLVACKTAIGAEAFAKLLRREVLRLHGNPYEIVSDRDGRFTSKYMREVCRLCNIKQAMSTAYHPQTDGQTERANRVLEQMLGQYVSPTHDDWDDHLDMIEFAVNDAWQESVQETPFMLNYGQHPLNFLSMQTHSGVPAAATFVGDMRQNCERAIECLKRAQRRQKAYADLHRQEVTYKVGDKVLLNTKNVRWRSPGAPKLMPRFIGPFVVLEVIGKVAYRLDLPVVMKMQPVFHVSLLQQWHAAGNLQPPPPRFVLSGEQVYTVDR